MAQDLRKMQKLNGKNLNGLVAKKDFSRKHNNTKNKVELELKKKGGRFSLVVSVYSTHKPGLKATNAINPGLADSQKALQHLVEVSAGACGEHLAENYGDLIDPDKCAKVAREIFYDLFKKIAESGRDVGSITGNY